MPWLILFATAVFAWGSFGRGRRPSEQAPARAARRRGRAVRASPIYGGYFGGGIGFLMLAALTLAGLQCARRRDQERAGRVMNASAVVIFVFSHQVAWLNGAVLCVGAIAGGLLGAWLLKRVNEKWLRVGVVVLGVALTVALFLRRAWG